MLYGRDEERERIGALLDAARRSRSGALVVSGEPGVGKTALLEDARERATDMRVLAARGVESESELPFGALHQLLRPALDDADRLPPGQAAALRAALGLGGEAAPERFLVFAAVLSLLSELSERRPLLCLVDDAHWLDGSSADALRFVARRIDAEGVVLLFGAREGDVRTFDAPDLPTMRLTGLEDEAAAALLGSGAGVGAAPPVVGRLVEQARGNALALLELPAALSPAQLAGEEPLPEALPLTDQVERVFLDRVRRLPDDVQRAVLVAAADDTERVAVVARASERIGAGPEALDAAERAGLVVVRGRELAFRHPLVRSAVYGAATSSERRAAHAALADALAADGEYADHRAWHLAASALDADEDARARARGRGRARRGAGRPRRRRPGAGAGGRAVGRRAGPGPAPGRRRARGQPRRGGRPRRVARAAGGAARRDARAPRRGRARARSGRDPRAAAPATSPPPSSRRRARCWRPTRRRRWSCCSSRSSRRCTRATGPPRSRRASWRRPLDPPDDDDEQAFVVLCLSGVGAMAAGDTEAGVPRLEAALARAESLEDPLHLLFAGHAALWLGDDDRMAAALDRGIRSARARGTLGGLTELLAVRASQFFLAQRFDGAALAATEALRFARDVGADNLAVTPLTILAYLAALRGDDDEALAMAGEALELSTARGLLRRAEQCAMPLGFMELGRGRYAEALARLEGVEDPLLVPISAPDRIEAAVRLGRLDDARQALAAYAPWAEGSGAAWARPRLESCRALVVDGDEASARFAAALELADDARPLDLARIHLLYGEHLRRERRRVDARAQLRAALEGFERLGAAPWARAGAGGAPRVRRDRAPPRARRRRGAHPAGAAGRPARRAGALDQGRRRAALPLAADDRLPPAAGVLQAGDHLADPARAHPARRRRSAGPGLGSARALRPRSRARADRGAAGRRPRGRAAAPWSCAASPASARPPS